MKTPSTVVIIPAAQKWIAGFIQQLAGIEQSCKDLAAMVEANPDVFDQIVAADQRFNYNMLESMRKVGKGELYCELLFDPSLAARKLLPLPVAQQKKLYNEPVQVVKSIGGKNVVESKPLNKLSRHELSLVIDDDNNRVRTVEQQIAFVQPPAPAKRAQRFEINEDGTKISVLAATEFTLSNWEDVLHQAKERAMKSLAKK